MITYNQTNFFKHTFCEFQQIENFSFPENNNYKSKFNSIYFYTKEGVYRKSNHWGRVANCKWKLISDSHYKNQKIVTGFAKWNDFYPINSIGKNFFITVDFKNKITKIKPKKEKSTEYLFTFSEANKRVKQINYLFKNDKWARHYTLEINSLRLKIITEFISSNKTLQEIKLRFK